MSSNRKLKNGDSYRKLCELVSQTDEFKFLRGAIVDRIRNAEFKGFEYETDYRGEAFGVAVVSFSGISDQRFRPNDVNRVNVWITRDSLILKSEVEDLVSKVFGVTRPGSKKPIVPTYFCKAERLVEELYINPVWDLSEEMDRMKLRLETEINDKVKEESFVLGIQDKREEHIVEEIKKVLLRFKDITPAAIKKALDRYVMHEVMEN